MNKYFFRYCCALFLIVSIIGGCAGRTDPYRTRARARARYEKGTNRVYRRSGVYQPQSPEPDDVIESNAEIRAKRLADAVTELREIERACVVITGNTAIVGISPVDSMDDSELIKTKELVETKVRSTDAEIDHVGVSAASDMFARISRISDAGISRKNLTIG